MAKYTDNADRYAEKHTGKFFWGRYDNKKHNQELDGQCVSTGKRYIGTMAKVKDWFKARGHAKDFGDTLVKQGLAKVVSSPKRGDLAIWKKDGGGYGHLAIVLSGNRVFEGNVGIAGTKSKTIVSNDGRSSWKVYANRVDPLNASWRVGSPTFYRLNGYKEVKKPAKSSVSTGIRIKAKGTAKVTVNKLNVRNSPDTKSKSTAVYKKGQKFTYDSYIVTNGYVWLSYVSYSRKRRYVAEGPFNGNKKDVYVKGGVSK